MDGWMGGRIDGYADTKTERKRKTFEKHLPKH